MTDSFLKAGGQNLCSTVSNLEISNSEDLQLIVPIIFLKEITHTVSNELIFAFTHELK